MLSVTDHRHLALGWERPAAEALTELLAEPRSPSATGCLWCGVAHSVAWHRAPWQWPGNVATYWCRDCWRRWKSAGCNRGNPWGIQHAAEAAGLYHAPFDIAPVPTFLESNPPDWRGTLERFAYLRQSEEDR